jgi:hypothetical protein
VALSLYLPIPLTAARASATMADCVLRSQVDGSVTPLSVHTNESYGDAVAKGLAVTEILLEKKNASLLAAVSYAHVARRLEAAGESAGEFTAEVILNYCKALEVLWGETRDAIRTGASSLGYDAEETEGTFVALTILRDELDVAHPKVSTYSADSLHTIYSFVGDLATPMLELLARAIDATRAGTWTPRILNAAPEPVGLHRLLERIALGAQARSRRANARKPFGDKT